MSFFLIFDSGGVKAVTAALYFVKVVFVPAMLDGKDGFGGVLRKTARGVRFLVTDSRSDRVPAGSVFTYARVR